MPKTQQESFCRIGASARASCNNGSQLASVSRKRLKLMVKRSAPLTSRVGDKRREALREHRVDHLHAFRASAAVWLVSAVGSEPG